MWSTDNPLAVFVDGNAFWLIVGCLLAGTVFIVAWYGQRRGTFLVSAVAMVVLGGAVAAAEHAIVTQAERVERAVLGLAGAVVDGDSAAAIGFISPRAVEPRAQVLLGLSLVDVQDDLRVTDMQVQLSNENSRATSHFRANATLDSRVFGNLGRRPSRWLLTWQLEAGQWRVVRIQRLNPINGDEMPFQAQSET